MNLALTFGQSFHIVGQNTSTGRVPSGMHCLTNLVPSECMTHSRMERGRLRKTRQTNKSLSATGDIITLLASRGKNLSFRIPGLAYL